MFEYKQVEDEEIEKEIPGTKENCLLVGPKNFCVARHFPDFHPYFYNFQPRTDDVWVFGVPRSGTTLAQEMIWLLGNDLDYQKAAAEVLDVRFPVLECAMFFKNDYKRISAEAEASKYSTDLSQIAKELAEPAWEKLARATGRRFIKTHLPISLMSPDLLTKNCKIIYLARNPRDVCVSNFLLMNCFNSHASAEDFKGFWKKFKHGLYSNTPYFEHVKEGWDLRNHKNVKFLFYEEYTKDMRKTLQDLAVFLNKEVSEADLDKLENHLKIDNFKKNKSVNNDHLRSLGMMKDEDDNFIRKGKTGGWRDYFTDSLERESQEWIEENSKKFGIDIPCS